MADQQTESVWPAESAPCPSCYCRLKMATYPPAPHDPNHDPAVCPAPEPDHD